MQGMAVCPKKLVGTAKQQLQGNSRLVSKTLTRGKGQMSRALQVPTQAENIIQ